MFDELINYKGYEDHEWKALLKCVDEYGWEFEWIAQSGVMEEVPVIDVYNTQQVALRLTKV